MRNSVVFEIARKTSLAGPRGGICRGGAEWQHLGNYYLCEHIKVDENRANIVELMNRIPKSQRRGGTWWKWIPITTRLLKTSIRQMPVNIKEPDEDVLNSTQMAYIEGT